MIEFKKTIFAHLHGPAIPEFPQARVIQTEYFGVRGVSEIHGNLSGRMLEYRDCLIIRRGYDNFQQFYYIDLPKLVGTVDTIIETGLLPGQAPNCRFVSFLPDSRGPLQDVAGQLARLLGAANKLDAQQPVWFVRGTLQFYQLDPLP